MPWYVYILECGDGTLYTGTTNQLGNRISAHNAAKGAKYTASRLPVKLMWHEPHQTRSAALKREIEIKGWTRQQKLNIITGQ